MDLASNMSLVFGVWGSGFQVWEARHFDDRNRAAVIAVLGVWGLGLGVWGSRSCMKRELNQNLSSNEGYYMSS